MQCRPTGTLFWLTLVVSIGIAKDCPAQPQNSLTPIEWTTETQSIAVTGQHGLELFLDSAMTLTFSDLQKPGAPFKLSHEPVPSAGYGQQNLWARFQFKNESANEDLFYLDAEYSFYDEIELFLVRGDGSLETRLMGDTLPFHNRAINKYTFVFPIQVSKGETVTIYLRATSEELTLLRLSILNQESLQRNISHLDRWIGILSGAIIIMLLYNFGLFISVRDKRYLLFILYGGANYLALFAYSGFAYQFIWPNSPGWHAYSIQVLTQLQAATLLLFTRSYIDLPNQAKLYLPTIWLERLCWAAIVTSFIIPQSISLGIAAVLVALAHGQALLLGAQACILKMRHAYYFIGAFGFMLLAMLATALMALSPELTSFAVDDFFEYGLAGGAVCLGCQLGILSLGLGDRFNQVQKINESITRKNLEMESQARARLEAEVGKQTLQLREQNAKLQALDKQKTHFFQNISHELRTPLTLILNPLEVVVKKHGDDPSLKMAMRNAQRLLRLVNQLLDFQKLGAGQKNIELRPVNFLRFLRICADYFSSACTTKNIEFLVTIEGEPLTAELITSKRIFVAGEVDALEKITFNYLSNAIKFTPENGRIELGVTLTPERGRLFVKDSGPGISKENQESLFQAFSQIDGTATRNYEGTGLGLAYVKSLTEAMGGNVGIESEAGQGSSFWADFNRCADSGEIDTATFKIKDWLLADAPARTQEAVDKPNPNAAGKGETILVVDDLSDMRRLISGTLRAENYHVETSTNGLLGLSKVEELRPDLIISDWMMPEMTGPEMVKRLKADSVLASTPVILLTAKSDAESKLLGTEVGADAFLGKPFNTKELLSIVHNLLTLKEREKEVANLNRHITENVLKRYLPPNLIEDILDGRLKMEDEAQAMAVTLLFSDLSGFTAMSELLGAEQMALLLNEYLTEMNEVIFAHGGTIDKFMGDGIMVIFGAPHTMPRSQQAQQAVACGKAMQKSLANLCESWRQKNIQRITMRVGIHQGIAVVGNFGSKQRSDYTAIGPTVNLASRIETSCAQQKVYISSAVAQHLSDNQCIEVGHFKLKGIEEPMKLYMVTEDSHERATS